MTPEQILQINEQMAKICGYEYTLKIGSIIVKQKGSNCAEYFWYPNVDWNHLIEVYNACIPKWLQLDEDNRLLPGTKEEAMGYHLNNVFWVDPRGLLIGDAYNRLNRFIELYNALQTPGTQSTDRNIPDTRR